MAEAIDAERRFDQLPVLADALEDSGCSDADLLAHCRAGAPHFLGCWVVDLLLGKAVSSLRFPPPRGPSGAIEPHAGHRYESAVEGAHRILSEAAEEWAEGHPEEPPTERVLQRVLALFVEEQLLRRPFGAGPT
jgi:hypothetical protein